MKPEQFVIGVDYGTDSVRAIIVNADNGSEVASSSFFYPRWRDGLFCNPVVSQFRQHPLDYIEGLQQSIGSCLKEAGAAVRANVTGISICTTGSTPIAVDERGVPLAMYDAFINDPDALFWLWKDHSAIAESEEINLHAKKFETDYLKYVGGIYSSEWFWAKLLHVQRESEAIRKACYSWVEHCDWMPFLLTGGKHVSTMKRSVCAAGHKALWSAEWDGLPPDGFFTSLDPLLKGFRERLYQDTFTAAQPAGKLSAEWAQKLSLTNTVTVGTGAFDAHVGAVGGQIQPYYLSKVMGTSTCDMLVVPESEMKGIFVQGICGQVKSSIIPGMIGMEAGQSAFGDVFAWFKNLLSWPLKHLLNNENNSYLIDTMMKQMLPKLGSYAAQIPLEDDSELSLDWFNGRRTPDANGRVKACISGLDLGTGAPEIFRSLVESTCFGARAIVERFREQGVPVKGLIGIGGVSRKSPLIMQMLADTMEMPIRITKSDETCALGAAMFAAVSAQIYPNVEEAMNAMGAGFDAEYHPDLTKRLIYLKRYERYKAIGRFIEQLPN